MDSVFKKITKLLCCLIISLFIMGIGGEVVKADDNTPAPFTLGKKSDYVEIGGRNSEYVQGSGSLFHHFTYNGNDIFCLNSGLPAPTEQLLSYYKNYFIDVFGTEKDEEIASIIDTSEKLEGFNEHEKYFMAQTAIWYHLYGTKAKLGDSTQNGLYKQTYDFIQDNSRLKSAWNKIFEELKNLKPQIQEYTLEINKDSDILSVSDDDMVSQNLKIQSNVDGEFNVTIDQSSASGSCIEYNGSCENSKTISKDSNFIVKTPKPTDASGNVEITINITPQTLPTKTTVNVFAYTNSFGGIIIDQKQNMALVTKTPIELSKSITLHGEYTNTANVKIQKVDYENPTVPVAGATLEVYRLFDNGTASKIGSYISQNTATELSLPVGNYKLVEIQAPDEYILTNESIDFSVVENSGTLEVIQDGVKVDSATISIKNKKLRVKFRKLDSNGRPVEGAAFLLIDSAGSGAAIEKAYICAMSDEQGYLTKPCDDTVTKVIPESSSYIGTISNYNATPTKQNYYELGFDLGGSTDILFNVIELYTTKVSKDAVDNFNKSLTNYYGFSIDDYFVVSYSPNITHSIDKSSNTPIVTFNFSNEETLKISKTDITGGNEIPNAHLSISDPSVDPEIESADGKGNIVDEWISGTSSHDIQGLLLDHIYELKETLAPEGYVSVSTSIYFSMNNSGKITLYEDATGTTEIQREDIILDTNNPYHMLVTNDVTKVQFNKTDAVTGDVVANAVIKICTLDDYNNNENDCNAIREVVTKDSTETEPMEMLPVGKYVFIETTTPAGYVKQTKAVEFEVDDVNGIQQVNFTNTPTKLVIRKLDQVTGERVGGAKFQILDAETREVAKTASGVELVYETVADKDWEIYAIPAGKYILVETTYPEGYQEGMIIDGIVTTEYEFTISDQEGDVNIDVGIEVLNAPSTGISTLNLFAIGGLMVFVGYETIKIYRKKAING